jgi:hypothetical protein
MVFGLVAESNGPMKLKYMQMVQILYKNTALLRNTVKSEGLITYRVQSAAETVLPNVKSNTIFQSHGRSSVNFYQTVHFDVARNKILHTHP